MQWSASAWRKGARPDLAHPARRIGRGRPGMRRRSCVGRETAPGAPDADADDGGPHAWGRSPLATSAEADTVAAAAALLADLVPEMLERHPQLLEPSGPLLEIQLLRHLRALGPSGTAKQTASGWRNAWEWKKANRVHDLVNGLEREERRWLAARDLPHGAWATRHLRLGMRCGRARGGHPVKVERMGAYDTAAILASSSANGSRRSYVNNCRPSSSQTCASASSCDIKFAFN